MHKSKDVLKLFTGFVIINYVSSLNSQMEKPVETSLAVPKTTDKPRTSRHKNSKSFMTNPSIVHEINDGGFPDVTYPTSIIDAREQFYFAPSGIDDVLRPFSDEVRNSYRALKAEKVPSTNYKALDDINVANRKKPSVNQTVPQTVNKDNVDNSKSLNLDDAKKIINDFNVTRDESNATNIYFCLNPVEEDRDNMTICLEEVAEDPMLFLEDIAQLSIYTELESEQNTNNTDSKSISDAKVSNDNKDSNIITDLDDLEFLTKLNNTRNIFDSILNGIDNLQSSTKKPNSEEAMENILSRDNQTWHDKQSKIQVIHDEEQITNNTYNRSRDSSEDFLKSDSNLVSNISDGIPSAFILGQATTFIVDKPDSTETSEKDILTQLDSQDYNGVWLVNSADLISDPSNALYKIYLVGPLSLLDSTELEHDTNEFNMKSAANSISTFDSFKSARKPLSVLFNFSSSDS